MSEETYVDQKYLFLREQGNMSCIQCGNFSSSQTCFSCVEKNNEKTKESLKNDFYGPSCCRKHWEEKHKMYSQNFGEALINPIGMPFMVCNICGNKRCPKATDCELNCTNSNEAGQEGSIYG